MKEFKIQSLEMLRSHFKDGTFKEVIDDWKWIFSYSRKYIGSILLYTVLGLLSATMGVVSSIAMKYVIDIITGYQMDKLAIVIGVMAGSIIFNAVFKNWTQWIAVKLRLDINNDIQMDIFEKIMDAEWLKLSKYPNGDLLNRFNSDVGTVSSNAVSWLPTIIIAVYNFVVTFLVIMYYDKIMALIALASTPLLILSSRVILKTQREYGQKVRESSSDLMAFETETFSNYDTIKSFGVSGYYGAKMRDWQQRYKGINLKYNLFSIKTNLWMTFLSTLVQFAAFGYCLFLLWTQSITFGTMTLFLQQRSNLSSAFNSLIGLVPAFLDSSVSAHRIRELLELPKEEHLAESTQLQGKESDGFSIEMHKVDFSYVEGRSVITESDFKACPGEIVAMVGPSGEGKTTLIRMILGLIKPENGEAVIRAADGTEVQLNAEVRHLFAYVPQGNTIFSGSIADNLRMAKEDATDEEIIEALKIACAWDFVKNMPEGIHSSLGERGRGLSEGQAQRIAIARAVLRDTPVLLLDEATSALDVETERKVLRHIIRERSNKTCIVTTHRPSVLGMCERVYRVMENRITELTPEESAKMAMDF